MTSNDEMALARRAGDFADLLARCEVTGRADLLALEEGLAAALRMVVGGGLGGGCVYVVGNGGSASIASHAVNDFINVGKMRAATLHDAALLTCMANDYGYENAFARVLAQSVKPGDVLIAISSSGRSMNIRNAAEQARVRGCAVITLSGFARDNPLRAMGDLNFWLDSTDYGLVEVGHQFILHNMSDRLGRRGTN